MKKITTLLLASLLNICSLQIAFASSEPYSIVASPGWTEGNLWWNCTTSNCAIFSFAPNGDGNYSKFWNAGPLPLGHYYWLGSVSVLSCIAGKWSLFTSTPGWYFNYDPRTGDQSAVAGGECGASSPTNIPNSDPGKPECNDQRL